MWFWLIIYYDLCVTGLKLTIRCTVKYIVLIWGQFDAVMICLGKRYPWTFLLGSSVPCIFRRSFPDRCVPTLDRNQGTGNKNSYSQNLGFLQVPSGPLRETPSFALLTRHMERIAYARTPDRTLQRLESNTKCRHLKKFTYKVGGRKIRELPVKKSNRTVNWSA